MAPAGETTFTLFGEPLARRRLWAGARRRTARWVGGVGYRPGGSSIFEVRFSYADVRRSFILQCGRVRLSAGEMRRQRIRRKTVDHLSALPARDNDLRQPHRTSSVGVANPVISRSSV